MAFKLKVSETYTAPVTVEIPTNGGKFEKQTFIAEFKRLNRTALREIIQAAADRSRDDREIVDDVLVGWSGITDENGDELEFTPENADRVFEVVQVVPAIVSAFFATITSAKEKN